MPHSQLPSDFQTALDKSVAKLKSSLGENLHSLVLYGSSVRGGFDPASSNLNLLIILQASTGNAHRVIREALKGKTPIEPFVVELGEIDRASRVFALKFLSIKRDYKVLHGVDPLVDLDIPHDLLVIFTEQELRNLRMRMVRSYITAGPRHRHYHQRLTHQSSRILIVLSDCLRCAKVEIPRNLPDRIPVFEKLFATDVSILHDLLKLKHSPSPLTEDRAFDFHSRLVKLLRAALAWIESQYPGLPL